MLYQHIESLPKPLSTVIPDVLYGMEFEYNEDNLWSIGISNMIEHSPELFYNKKEAINESISVIKELRSRYIDTELVVLSESNMDDDGTCVFIIDKHAKWIVKAKVTKDIKTNKVVH